MKDLIVIGGGPGGYVAAIKAAQLGKKVLLVEKESLGGTCLNRGCIPTKTLLHGTSYLNTHDEAKAYGIDISINNFDINKIIKRKNQVVKELVFGIDSLIKKNKIEMIYGTGKIINNETVEITSKNDGKIIQKKAKNIIIATGSKPSIVKVPGYNLPGVITSDEALNMDKVPKDIAIIGGGVVGLEMAYIYNNLGTKVTIIEMMPQLLKEIDQEVIGFLEAEIKKAGIDLLKNTKLDSINQKPGTLEVKFSKESKEGALTVEQVLMATGRAPYIEGLGLEEVGIKIENGKIATNEFLESSMKGIYAIGDVSSKIQLAHVASAEAIIAVENSFGEKNIMDYRIIPSCIFTKPELAGIGLTEVEAKKDGYDVQTGSFYLASSGKARAVNSTEGIVKVIAEKKYGEILGVHILGDRATDIIAEAALAMKLEATIGEFISTIHAHPTMAENLNEAMHDVYGICIHK